MLGYRKKSSYCLLEVSYQLPYRAVRRLRVGKAAGRRKNETKLCETSFVDRDKKIEFFPTNLFNVVASFSACFNKHNVKLPRLSFSFLGGNLEK